MVEFSFRLHLFFMVKNDKNCDFITTDWQLKKKKKEKEKKKSNCIFKQFSQHTLALTSTISKWKQDKKKQSVDIVKKTNKKIFKNLKKKRKTKLNRK